MFVETKQVDTDRKIKELLFIYFYNATVFLFTYI